MINFAQAQYLILLLLVPFFFVAYAVMRHFRKRRLSRLGDPVLVRELMPSVSSSKGWVRVTLFAVAFFFFVIGLSRPQIGAKLKERNIKWESVSVIASAELKRDEPGLLAFAQSHGVALRFFGSDELNAVEVPNPSAAAEAPVGIRSVSEAAALLAAGPGAELVVEKTAAESVTAAIAEVVNG